MRTIERVVRGTLASLHRLSTGLPGLIESKSIVKSLRAN